jgi:hypothetical protein
MRASIEFGQEKSYLDRGGFHALRRGIQRGTFRQNFSYSAA